MTLFYIKLNIKLWSAECVLERKHWRCNFAQSCALCKNELQDDVDFQHSSDADVQYVWVDELFLFLCFAHMRLQHCRRTDLEPVWNFFWHFFFCPKVVLMVKHLSSSVSWSIKVGIHSVHLMCCCCCRPKGGAAAAPLNSNSDAFCCSGVSCINTAIMLKD